MLWPPVAAICAWALGRGFGLERGYPLVPLMAFTPYAAAVAVLVTLVAVAMRRPAEAVVAGAAALALVAAVAPRAIGGDAGPQEGRTMRVGSVNLHRGRASPAQVVALARRVDVLSLQEVSAGGVRRLERAGLREHLPGRALALGRNEHGTAIYARAAVQPLPLRTGTWNAQAVARVDGVEFTAVHPPAPFNGRRARVWRDELRSLPAAGGRLRVLAGDFNATLDHAPLRRLLAAGYRDAAVATGSGLRGTWPVGRRMPPVTIDHVLVDERIGVRRVRLHEIDGSDHRAIVAELVVRQ